MSDLFYFSYGSNMDLEQMAIRCPMSKSIGVGCLRDFQFLINSRGVATLVSEPGNRVFGLIWSLSRDDELRLDRYEGVPISYQKTDLLIQTFDKEINALVYLATNTTRGNPRPSYMERIVCAAEKHGFELAYIEELKKWIDGQSL